MISVAVAGQNGGIYSKRWTTLIDQIEKTCNLAEVLLGEKFGRTINGSVSEENYEVIEEIKNLLKQKEKISKFSLLFHSNWKSLLEQVQIDGKPIQSAQDCDLLLHSIEVERLRKQCALYWDELMVTEEIPTFYDLDKETPEEIARNWIPNIRNYLDWHKKSHLTLMKKIEIINIPADIIFDYHPSDSKARQIEKKLSALEKDIPIVCSICLEVLKEKEIEDKLEKNKQILQQNSRINSKICNELVRSIENQDINSYKQIYEVLKQTYEKYQVQQIRDNLLLRLSKVAPRWAQAIKNREGIHGSAEVPDNILQAWKWKNLKTTIEELTKEPFVELQKESLRLSKIFRETTAVYAEKSAWYHLLRKTEGDKDMSQALQGWKQTIKRIGKGTGKNAPRHRARARELMVKCQEAVPAWIMPISRALDSLNPKKNKFDVVIIDEASQADLSALAILYLGKQLVIVGDDKQVSPMGIGTNIDQINSLQQMFIRDIPNYHLYDSRTSVYDIAKTTFQPLMLREHFRCVPEIIGYSNMLSYDYKIKPLRDANNSVLIPPVVNFRVLEGERLHDKTNPKEAQAIVSLLQACIEQPEYEGKTFGIISLLGYEQVKLIQQMLEKNINPNELVSRKILCGNASNFQGDERDVIFLSMVDSNTNFDKGPIKLQSFGTEDAYRKRYNVATSRAKDQLWVVHSLDSGSDLKPGDIRKTLLDYSLDPTSHELIQAEIESKAEAPFEASVAQALVNLGYNIIQQKRVGAYRLDMVAIYQNQTVAIECDGERYHSGEERIREDMERQTILERLGWRFIRIRGSEYYRDPDKTIDRVIGDLQEQGIFPDSNHREIQNSKLSSTLLDRVKHRAQIILAQENDPQEESDLLSTMRDMVG